MNINGRLIALMMCLAAFSTNAKAESLGDSTSTSGVVIQENNGSVGGTLSMQSPRIVISGSGSRGWANIVLHDAPSDARFVMLQVVFTVAGWDGVGNSYIQARSQSGQPIYTVAGMRAAGDRDAVGGAGQAFIPINQVNKTIQTRVTRSINGSYSLSVIGFM